MKKLCSILLLILVFLPALTNASTKYPMRVVTLSPALTEIIFSLKLENRLVGVSDFSDFPKEAGALPKVGAYMKPNYESILATTPDLIIVPAEAPSEVLAALRNLKVPALAVPTNSFEGIETSVVEIASALGKPEAASSFLKSWRENVRVAEAKKISKPLNAIVQVQTEPLMVAGDQTFLNEMINRCGVKNSYSDKQGYFRIDPESAVEKSPKLIVIVDHLTKGQTNQTLSDHWKNLIPQNTPKIIIFDEKIVGRPGPRLPKALNLVCEAISKAENPASTHSCDTSSSGFVICGGKL